MSKVIENKHWPIPCHSSEKEKMDKIVKAGGTVQLTYGVSVKKAGTFVGEINPAHEARRRKVEQECKQKI